LLSLLPHFIATFLIFGSIFVLIDFVWVKLTSRFYQQRLHGLLRTKPNLWAASTFYALYIFGVTCFVPMAIWSSRGIWLAMLSGAVFGMVAYATYDLTNLATLKKWSVKVTVIDVLWGAIATSLAATITFLILLWWL